MPWKNIGRPPQRDLLQTTFTLHQIMTDEQIKCINVSKCQYTCISFESTKGFFVSKERLKKISYQNTAMSNIKYKKSYVIFRSTSFQNYESFYKCSDT